VLAVIRNRIQSIGVSEMTPKKPSPRGPENSADAIDEKGKVSPVESWISNRSGFWKT
jgi:hypothetical protein